MPIRIFKQIQRNSREMLIISEEKFNGRKQLDVRRYFKKKASDGAFRPSRRGVRFHDDELRTLLEVMTEYIEEKDQGAE